ncbi:MAG: cell wall hydrolase [Sphingomonadales bacterium]|jgi:spore germination cell wall hydrolase CwlJ-like protein|nr:cell wall hydrolase [Sphingomonadales bacterium]
MIVCVPRLILAAAALAALPVAVAAQEIPPRYFPPLAAQHAPEAAAECLALAITYEAGQEPLAGQEAVAQVILNRVRHSAYPDSVCAVVWQGAERRTGCQFTFTCDGSLRRPRSAAQMAAARAVALRVLAGQSPDHVHGATHYHADYVAPYWAPSLTRVRQIARHVFYRSPGAVPARDSAPVTIALAARHTPPAPAPAPEPIIRNGEFAPWGLSLDPGGR